MVEDRKEELTGWQKTGATPSGSLLLVLLQVHWRTPGSQNYVTPSASVGTLTVHLETPSVSVGALTAYLETLGNNGWCDSLSSVGTLTVH